MLSAGSSSDDAPLTVQYSGRHISHPKLSTLNTELSLAWVIGKIEFGTAPATMPQVIVPACWAPLAAGIEPMAPAKVVGLEPLPCELLPPALLLLLLLHAATNIALAAARAIPPTIRLFISPPSFRSARDRCAVGSWCIALLSL